jgi:hypothetical protein
VGKFDRFLALLSGIYTGLVRVPFYALLPLAVVTLVVFALINQAAKEASAAAQIILNSACTAPSKLMVIAMFSGFSVMLFNKFGGDWLKKCFYNTS